MIDREQATKLALAWLARLCEAVLGGPRLPVPHTRYLAWADLTRGKLTRYENNWTLIEEPLPSASPLA